MKVENQVHKCISKNSDPSTADFCVRCGVFMSKCTNQLKYYRSNKYNINDPFRLDNNVVLSEMKKKQDTNHLYAPEAQYIQYRSELLTFMKYLCDKVDYAQRTYYLAVGILDNLLSKCDVAIAQLKFVCFMTLHMAGKMEEKLEKIPDLVAIERLFEGKFSTEEIHHWEIIISKSVEFNFDIKTPFNFVEYFLSKGIVNDIDIGVSHDDIQIEVEIFEQEVMNFLYVSVQHHMFNAYTPLTVAAASIFCAKQTLGYQNIWSFDLEKLTTLKFTEIQSCSKSLYQMCKRINGLSNNMKGTKTIKPKINVSKNNGNIKMRENTLDMTLPACDAKSKLRDSDVINMDTDEEEPIKNTTVYKFVTGCKNN